MCNLASVTWCVTWCALLLSFGCANARQETDPSATTGNEPSSMAAAGQPSSTTPTSAEPSWCEARDVLERNCQRCHGETPSNGAPFSLVTYEDTQAPNKKGKARYQTIAQVIESELMPPTYLELEPPVQALGSEDRQLLLTWCEQGAPGDSSDACAARD